MLKIQKWLKENNFDYTLLNELYGITSTFNDDDNRVILNYSQINSPKDHDVINECRAIVLDKTDASIIARAFNRFYNWGEIRRIDNAFDFNNCTAT